MVEQQQTNIEKKQPDVEKKQPDPHEIMLNEFDAKRADMGERMKQAAAAFRTAATLLEAEHILYTVRQDLVDYKAKLATAIAALSRQLKAIKNNRMMAHKTNKVTVVPANATERKAMDDAFLAKVTEVVDKFDAQIDWTKDCIEGCDEMANGISYYIKLANILGNVGK